MATLTNEQIEQKKQQLKQLAEEVKTLKDELVEAGAWPMDDDDLDQATGGTGGPQNPFGYGSVDDTTKPKPGFHIVDHNDQYDLG